MMKMQPVPAQDRPKMIAVVIGIGVALMFVVRSLGGTPIQAHSGQPKTAPAALAPVSSLPPPTGLPAAEAPPAGPEASFGGGEGLPLTDPFHPLPQNKAPLASARTAPAAAHEVASSQTDRPVAAVPAPITAPAPAVADSRPPAPPERPARTPEPRLIAEPSVATVLVGTVGQERCGVAILRGVGKSVFARVGEVVAGWRITSIRLGQVRVAHAAIHRRVRVGEELPAVDPPARDPRE